jgi:AcrR family transcriptional regulator
MKRRKDGPGTRKQIGDTAIRLFEKGGVKAVSMRKIASEVGVTPMAIYNHFENMEDLLLFVYERGVQKLARSIRIAMGKQAGARQKLKALMKSYVRFGYRNPHYYNLLFGTEFIQKYLWDTPPRSLVMVGFWSRLAEAVEDGQREGVISQDRNTQEVATHLWSSMHGYTTFLIMGRLQQLWRLPEAELMEMMTRNLIGSVA